MKKLSPKMFLVVALFLVLLGSVFVYNTFQPRESTLQASFTDYQNNINEAFNNADLVMVAKVISGKSYEQYMVIFTDYSVVPEKILKNKYNSDSIVVSLTGGDLNFKKERMENQKLLDTGDTYLFLLKKRYSDDSLSNQYCLIGGYQGAIKLQAGKNNSLIGVKFNPQNNLEDELIGKELKEILKY